LNSNNLSPNRSGLDIEKLPAHIAIIMDGNGRWAKKKLLNRIKGHEKGSETVRTIVQACREIGISYLTLYAFSTENWQRSKTEVAALMSLLERFLKSEEKEMMDNNIRLQMIGQMERLPVNVRNTLKQVMDSTNKNSGMCLSLALSYGSRPEIVRMVRELAKKARNGALNPDLITEDLVAKHLYTAEIPDPDLLIRTSGEYRISNFLLWQIAYAEIFITNTLWPDFGRDELIHILKDYQQRDRRFGKV